MIERVADCHGFSELSLGGKQLVRTYAHNSFQRGEDPNKIIEEDIIPYVRWIERMEIGEMTYGIEIALPFEIDEKTLRIVNALAGTSTMKPSEIKKDMTELRLNPSYSMVVTYLVEELWKAKIIPVDHTISYGLNVCNEAVMDKSFLLAVANVAHGLTLEWCKENRKSLGTIEPETLVQPMLHIGRGRDIYTGDIISAERINFYTGLAARLEKRDVRDSDWVGILADDFR